MTIGALILAAGMSRRMGANKLLADLGGAPVIAHTCRAAAEADLPLLVVTGHEPAAVRAGLPPETATAFAEDYRAGMGASLATGVTAVPDHWTAAIVMLGDMPLIPSVLLRKLAAAATPENIVVPQRSGRKGNPVCWGRAFFPELAALTGDRGGKLILQHHPAAVRFVAADTDAIFMDADTPDSLEDIRKAAAGG